MGCVNLTKINRSLILLIFGLTLPMAPVHRAWAAPEEGINARLVEGAKKEGELLLYSNLSIQEGDRLLRKFQDKYPFIKASMYRVNSSTLLPRMAAEDQSKRYLCDVVSASSLSIDVLKRKKFLAKYLSSQDRYIPEAFKDPEGYGVAAYYMIKVLAYNTKMVAPREVPKTYDELLDPKWKGKIGMDAGAYYWFASVLRKMGEEKGLQYMKRLAEQNLKFRVDQALNSQMVAAGELSLTIPVNNHTVDRIKTQGGPIEWTALEPVIVDSNTPSLSAHAPHPNAARLFIDFVLSREGQEVIVSIDKLPTRDDVEGRIPRAKTKAMKISASDPAISEHYEKYTKLFREVLMKRQPR